MSRASSTNLLNSLYEVSYKSGLPSLLYAANTLLTSSVAKTSVDSKLASLLKRSSVL